MVVIAVIGIASATSYETFFNVLPNLRADSAMQLLQAQMRQAREASVDQRRNIQFTFRGTNEMVTSKVNLDASTTQISDFFLPFGMIYTLFSDVPDTPDAYGKTSAVTFGCTSLPCTITFLSDGSVLGGTGASVNGSVFIGMTNRPLTARAVTTLAATGKIKGYHWDGSVWH